MRILYLCTFYHRAMIFRDAMDKLTELGHEVRAFNAVAKGTIVDKKYKPLMDHAVVHCECFNGWDRFLYFRKQQKIYHAFLSSFDPAEYDLIHSHTLFNGGYVAYLIKKKYSIPYIVSVRNTDVNVFLKIPGFSFIANKIIREADGVQFLSMAYRDRFIDKCIDSNIREAVVTKSEVIVNGLEEFWLQNISSPKVINIENAIQLLCVGKIDENKNLMTTIAAVELLREKGYKIVLTVAGQTIDHKVMDRINNADFVRYVGYLEKEQLIHVYRSSHIYIMPSIHESFGRVYIEAMSQGLPVIYTRNQGFDGLFEDGVVGYSVPSDDPQYIATAIQRILDNYSEISRRCIQHSRQFDWGLVTRKLSDFYFRALQGGGRT